MDIRKRHMREGLTLFLPQFLKLSLVILLLASFLFAFNHLKHSQWFPIKTVRVYGLSHSDQTDIKKLLLPLVNSSFFSVDIERMQTRLRLLPWISGTVVRKVWPDQLEVTLIEKNAIASWNNSKLLSEAGEIFMPSLASYPVGLPKFVGPNGKQIVMLEYFKQINRILMPLHAKIAYLELTPSLTWKLALDNGITLRMGQTDILTRIDHFVKVYPKIVGERAADVEYIDLRYPNGMAVRWKTMTMKA